MEPQELPIRLRGDKLRLQQILINLVKNAFKFTKKGSVRIVAAYDFEKQLLCIHVVDTGKGIRPEEMCNLFKLFGKL